MGNLYIADTRNNRIRKISGYGVITTIAGTGTAGFSGDGGPATSAQLSGPTGITLDAAGNIYFGDGNNGRIRKVGVDGVISTIAGSGGCCGPVSGVPPTSAVLGSPVAVALDAAGNLYITDMGSGVGVRRISPAADSRAPWVAQTGNPLRPSV
jgi:sugar lactone lactonase YvrE